MNEPEESAKAISGLNRFLAGLIALMAVAIVFASAYWPNRIERVKLEKSREEARERVSRLYSRIRRLERSRDELEAKQPDAIRDAIRETLKMDSPGSYMINDQAGM